MTGKDKSILKRFYLVVAGLAILFGAVPLRIFYIQNFEREALESLESENYVKRVEVPASRGNIFAADGKLLAISSPKFNIRMDVVTVDSDLFDDQVGELALGLSLLFKDMSKADYERKLREARRGGNRYLHIQSEISYDELQRLKALPIFEKGKYRGGLIVEQLNTRELPLGKLAERTIGYDRSGYHVGIEGAYSAMLSGQNGERLSQKISGGLWRPLPDANEIEPIDGSDVITTIDSRYQDVAQRALLRSLERHEADHGCAVVMHVETGAIVAIVNLGRTEEGKYYEKRNYAVWESTEPGSTFKLASIMAVLEDGVADTSDIVDTHGGVYKFYDSEVRDSRKGGYGKISLGRAFEVSSNVGIAKLLFDNYRDNPEQFVDRLYLMGLNDKTGIGIQGEGTPIIPTPSDSRWSGITLPWMSHGYTVSMTPLQVLTFYNAVANDGVVVRPYLVDQIQKNGKAVYQYSREVINPALCSAETLLKVQALLEGVVVRGTATNIYTSAIPMAGKTGTCKLKYWASDESEQGYQASFAGYFPANNPEYSCIVVVNRPDPSTGYYGSTVAAPVFAEIAEHIIAYKALEIDTDEAIRPSGKLLAMQSEEVDKAPYIPEEVLRMNTDVIGREVIAMPNLKGLPLADALYVIESSGLTARISGRGKVAAQSIPAGQKIRKGTTIKLYLES
jgi:cell division protein FtsI (penicillin-binding protein 3)